MNATVVDSINYYNYFVPDKADFNENKWWFVFVYVCESVNEI